MPVMLEVEPKNRESQLVMQSFEKGPTVIKYGICTIEKTESERSSPLADDSFQYITTLLLIQYNSLSTVHFFNKVNKDSVVPGGIT